MPDHLSSPTLSGYRHGRLNPAEMLAASDHLAGCLDCRRALEETGDGPSYDQLAAAVDGTLDPAVRARLAADLAESPAAAAELADLEQFKQEMAGQAGHVYEPHSLVPSDAADPREILAPPVETWRPRRAWFIGVAAAAAAVFLVAAGWWTLARPGRTTETARLLTSTDGRPADLAALPSDVRAGVERALREGRLDFADASAVLHPPDRILAGANAGAPAGFHLLFPLGAVVREERPVLRWTTCPTATAYVVTLTGTDGADTRSSPSLPATQTAWTPPAPLIAGAIYTWQVEALAGAETVAYAPSPPNGEARFQILPADRRAELTRVEKQFGNFPLVMAVAFARARLDEEATGQLTKLAGEHPDSSLARRLRKEVPAIAPAQSPSPITTKGAQ